MWVLDHEADIASDLSAIHRVDDPMTLDGPRYFSLAVRLAAYAGVIQARAVAAREEAEKGGSGAHSAAPTASRPGVTRERPSRVSDDTALAMLAAEGWAEHTTEEG